LEQKGRVDLAKEVGEGHRVQMGQVHVRTVTGATATIGATAAAAAAETTTAATAAGTTTAAAAAETTTAASYGGAIACHPPHTQSIAHPGRGHAPQ